MPLLRGLLVSALGVALLPAAQENFDLSPGELAKQFAEPVESSKPRTYWYWADGKVTNAGITRDLEAMKRAGVGEAYIGFIGGQTGNTGGGGVTAMTEAWWDLLEHAIREGGRLGVDIGLFNGLGWSQSGGPWVTQDKTMRHLVNTEIRVQGPALFDATIAAPAGALPGQDVATIAFPAPASDAARITPANATISGGAETAKMFDGNKATSAEYPVVNSQHVITIETAQPFTARSLVLVPSRLLVSKGELQVSQDGVNFTKVSDYEIERRYATAYHGPEVLAPMSISFPAVTARHFRLTLDNEGAFSEIELSGAARIEQYSEKHFGKTYQGPKNPPDYYDWPVQAEPEDPALCIPSAGVTDISASRNGDRITWQVPAGEWIIQRIAMAPTGSTNTPAPAGGGGLEIDKLNREVLVQHFDGYVGEVLRRMPAAERTALKHVVIDSYEVGSQTWTDGMEEAFEARYGYDPLPFLPTLGGRMVGSAAQSDRFLWDLRRLIADRVATEYIGGMRELANQHGLKLWSQNYGHGGFFGEFLSYGGHGDEISGEFWEQDPAGQVETRCASSAAHIYGKKEVFAEAWTGGPNFKSTPWSLKQMGDWAFCEGVNHIVFHVNLAQPDERRPGISAWFGTEFNRNNTWFDKSASWTKYLQRCHTMLKQGNYVADVAYYIGEDVPKFTFERKPALPAGYSFDYINSEVILNRLTVSNGRFVLPDGMSYRLLVLPEADRMRPEVLARLRDLVAQGGAIYGAPPIGSPSLQNYPACDPQVISMADDLWQGLDGTTVKSRTHGTGRVFRGDGLDVVLGELGSAPDLKDDAGLTGNDLLFIHRRTPDAEIYFLSNQTESPINLRPSFRVEGKAPELWDAVTGTRKPLDTYHVDGGRTVLPLALDAQGSVFVVFRGATASDRIVKLEKDGETVMDLTATSAPAVTQPSTFTTSLWVRPAVTTTIPAESKNGFQELYTQRADIIFPAQAQATYGDGHAGSGFAVGTNGFVAYEHGAQYFAPLLVYPASISAWTHFALVYDQAQTRLYMNGTLVRTGLKSDHVVHSGNPNTTYNGKFSGFRQVSRALTQAEIQELMQVSGPVGSPGNMPAFRLELTRGSNGGHGHLSWQSGSYTLTAADGSTRSIEVTPSLAALPVSGAWSLRLPSNSGVPSPVTLNALASLTEHANPNVRYFSGTAVYSKALEVPEDMLAADRRLFLDLGHVGSLARVILNGKDLGTLWSYPYRLDISKAANAGTNQLQVWVTNAWHNRLVGQQRSPSSFTGSEVLWSSSMPGYAANEPLIDSGLIGPVQLLPAIVGGDVPSAPETASAKIGIFTGGDPGEGLDLGGTIVHAINLAGAGTGGTSPDLAVAGVVFKDDYNSVNLIPGVTVGYQAIDNWEVRATYPNATQNDQNLAEIMWDVAHGAGIADQHPSVVFTGLKPGGRYALQVLASDSDSHPNRATTYHLYSGTSHEGVLQDSVTDLNLTALQGGTVRHGPIVNGVIVTLTGAADKSGNLYFCSPDGVVPGGTGTFDANGIVQALVLKEVGSPTPFQSWMETNHPALAGGDRSPDADPDGDGRTNLEEFALGGDPADAAKPGWVRGLVQDASPPAGNEFTLVFAALRGAQFSNATAQVDGVSYEVQGFHDLTTPDVPVSHLGTRDLAPPSWFWPDLSGTPWEYHTFKLEGSEGTPDRGFMRVIVEEVN
ncbi:glycosyl hydrolase [Luteolibacter flavescens]|uniref:Glycosyl hydrolase n=1 Tax=Luteolibacter flavescens TaxID=1859460 RepID=A0ABT3FI60_9BACT|nr:glycosyl hydrolase [Luteolibacter flavescens]MCW1883147.1 glycosyl hydrolase [Luteolibacter flavescens]